MKTMIKRIKLYVLLTVLTVFVLFSAFAIWTCYQAVEAEGHVRYVGMMNIASGKITKTVGGMEMNAMNVFDEVEKHLDSPESVIAALESKVSLNPEVRGYFAAFEPDYFPEKGTWFEPYVVHVDSSDFELRMVGSARHNYHKSGWYVRAKKSSESFWSDPYCYYDGTDISGHYTTFVKPVFDAQGKLACVCGADMTFEWLSKELKRIDEGFRSNDLLNRYQPNDDAEFYTAVLDVDGSCIASSDGQKVGITQEQLLEAMSHKESGAIDIDVNGVPSTVYYGPIERVNWSVVVVVAKQSAWGSLTKVGVIFLLLAVIGMMVVWMVCGRMKYAETE